eukprot:547265-Pelagomonas_calceolata.AAC.3
MECLRSNSEEGRRLEWRVLLHLHVCMTCERLLFAGSGGGAATDVKDTSQPQGKGQANQLDEVQGGLDPKDLKKPCAPAPATPERPPPSKPSSPSRAVSRQGEAEESPCAPKTLAQQDQALKAILDQARCLVQGAATATAITFLPGPTSSQKQAEQGSESVDLDAASEAKLIKSQLLALSSAYRPGGCCTCGMYPRQGHAKTFFPTSKL